MGGALGTTGKAWGGWMKNGKVSNTTDMPWSHWIPDRYIRPFTSKGYPNPSYKPWLDIPGIRNFITSPLNGNVVSKFFHGMTDNFAWQFLTSVEKQALWNKFGAFAPLPKGIQQILRLPLWMVGGTAMGASKALQCECGE